MIDLSSRLEELSPAKRELLLRQLKKLQGDAPPPRPIIRPRTERHGDFPLSYAQQRLWFLDQLEPGNPFYNLPGAVRLRGDLDEGCLGRALAAVVARHEALRTTFPGVEGKPVQRIGPPDPFPLPVIDLSALPEEERRPAGRALAMAAVRRPFDLAAGPLLRAVLLRLGDAERILAFAVHHIVADGWSLRILVRELTTLYQAFSQGAPSPLSPLAVQYPDYCVAERQWFDGGALGPQLDFWRQQLADLPGVLELPTDRPRPEVQTFRGSRQGVALSTAAAGAVRELGQGTRTTPFMVLLAAFAALLHRYSGRADFPVGTPIANRDRVETEGLIGFFVNTLVLRCNLSGNPTFHELLARVRERVLGAFAHPDLPFERLVEELKPDRHLGHTPIFQVMFAFQSLAAEARPASGPAMEAVGVDDGKSLFDLTLTLEETPGRVTGALEYNTDLFEPARMRRMAAHFEALVTQAVEHPGQHLSDLAMLTAAERHQIEGEWTDTSAIAAGDRRLHRLHELFEAQAARTPEAVAIIWGERRVTYRELDARADRLSRALNAAGVGRETRVAVCLDRSPELVAALLAVWKAGAAYVPLDPAYPEERLAYMLEDSGAKVLLAGWGLAESLTRRAAQVIHPEEVPDDGGEGARGIPGSPADLAYVIYTSGSTGRPKGVAIAHASAAVLLEWAGEVFSAAELAGVLGSTSVCFDLSVFELFVPLAHGGAVILAENALELPRLPAAGQVTLINTVPSAMAELVRTGAIPPSVRTVNLAGEVLRRSLTDGVYETPTVERVLNLYGPSEDTTYSTFVHVRRGERGAPTLGRPLANTRVYLADAQGALVPLGVSGEIWIGGDGLARGYLGRPDLTAERFVPDPFTADAGGRLYRTGDLARWTGGGELELLGRIDHQVKVRGFRIELGEVEVALERHPAVERAAVMASLDGQGLVAYVAGPDTAAAAAGLRSFLRASLPEHTVPSLFVPLPAFPLTPSGKIDRRALAAASPRPDPLTSPGYVPPRTPAEELLAGIWEQVLRIEGIGVHQSFFELGGHSLLATQMTSRIREAFAVELPLRAVFESPTLAGLAARIEEARTAGTAAAQPPLVRVPRDGHLPLSFGQQRLWFLDQLEPGSAAYNMPATVRLEGDLDPRALAASLDEVVRRHEVLRTVFRLSAVNGSDPDEPSQEIRLSRPIFLSAVDLTALPPPVRQTEALRLATLEARRPFDLTRGPLLRASLLRMSGSEHVLLLTLHHIVSDGWSMGVLMREVAVLYAALSRGVPSPLPELPVQYADYAAWQRGWLRGEVLEAQIAYWKRALAGVPPLIDLPTDRPRPPVQTFRGAHRGTFFAADLAAEVRRLGRGQGLTSFMVLLAALQTLLHRCSGQSVVAVGSPTAGRGRIELEGLIGFFTNTLVLAGDLGDEPSFRGLLAQVREASLGAYAHQDLPFEKLVEELAPQRNLAHSPLFQVLFVFQGAAAAAPIPSGGQEGGLSSSPFIAEVGAAKFDLTLEVTEQGGGFAASLEFNTDLFDPATASRLLEQLRAVLTAAAADPDSRTSELPLLAVAQRAQLLAEWNDTAAVFPEACLHELFTAQAARTPEAPAVIAPEGTVTFAELEHRASQLASCLRTLGVGPEVLVGICTERSLDMIVGMLGTLKAGGAYLPLDPAYPRERLDFMLADAAAPVVLTQERLLGRLEALDGPRCLCLDRDWPEIAAASSQPAATNVTPDHLAYTIYTSGSTGRPKGVAISHRSAAALLAWASEVFPERDRAGVLASTSICFDLSVFEIFLPLCHGGTVVLAETALHLPRLAAAGLVTLVNTVPSAIAELVRAEGLPTSVRTVNLAGEPLPRRLVDEIYRMPAVERVLNLYGPSEDTTYSTFATIDRGPGLPPIGRPVGGGRAFLLDAWQQPVPLGVPGELYLGGAGLARGYLNRPELTAERFVPDPFATEPGQRLYRTGDLVRYRTDGEMLFLGRIDHQVKVRGFRIELGEIEATLRRHPGVAEAVLLARGAPGDPRLVAYVAGKQGADLTVDELRGFLRAKLPAHMVPWAFVVLPSLPLNANGKIDRKALPDPERGAWGAATEIEEPQSDMERRIAALWREVLPSDSAGRVGIDDNFFDSGGHSLLAVRVYHRLKREVGREFPLVALFEHPTIRALARYLEAGEAAEAEPVSRQRGQDRGARRREAAAGRQRPVRPGATDHDKEL